jgi:predicted metal-dependent HD superfamily phosphohydrolase
MDLQNTWADLLARHGYCAATGRATFDDLARCYGAPERHYHTLDHIGAVLETVRSLNGGPADPALEFAVWFHDVVYDTHATDNEERSADHAAAVLSNLRIAKNVIAEIRRLILLTKTHQTAAEDGTGHILLDADLAILGTPAAEYDRYAAAIRREYAWVPDADYRRGRRRVLEQFLTRPRLYFTEALRVQRESAARDNLRREIVALTETAVD